MKQEGQQRTQAETPYPLDKPSGTIAPIQFIQAEGLHPVPVPFVRITTCGGLKVEVLQEIIPSDSSDSADPAEPPQGRYRLILPQQCPKGSTTALTLLKMLVSLPQHYAAKDWLAEHLPRQRRDRIVEDDGDEEDGWERSLVRLDNVVSILRNLLCPPELVALTGQETLRKRLITYVKNHRDSGPGYRLAGAPLLWLDVDALAALVTEAALREQRGQESEALSLWEQASTLAMQGRYLPEEPYSDWAAERRAEVDSMGKQAVLALRRLLLARHGQAAEERVLLLLRRAWQSHPTDEDLLFPLLDLLGQQERYQEAEQYYQQYVTVLDEEGSDQQPGQRLQELREFLQNRQRQQVYLMPGMVTPARSQGASTQSLISASSSLTGTSPIPQHIMNAVPGEEDRMDQLRRHILQQTLKGTSVALFAPRDIFAAGPELVERLTKALTRASSLDEKTLLYLEQRIEHYWQDRNTLALPVWDLFLYVFDDLQKVTALLEGSCSPATRTRLCSIAGATAMLIGELYYDMRHYTQARAFQHLAIRAAREADNQALEAVAWGRNSFAWTYDGNPEEARHSILQTHRLRPGINRTVRAWLAAVEAEIHAHHGDRQACLTALKEASQMEDRKSPHTDDYWIHFDSSLLAGYQGASFLQLSRLGHTDLTRSAQTALQEALNGLDPSMKRRQPTLLFDLAGTALQQRDTEQACTYALKAIELALPMNSRVLLQRLLILRGEMEPWKETRSVKSFDQSLEAFFLSGPSHNQERV